MPIRDKIYMIDPCEYFCSLYIADNIVNGGNGQNVYNLVA